MTISAVLFDLDGTLLDTALDFETAINGVLTDNNQPCLQAETIREHIGDGSAGIIKSVFGISRDDPEFASLQQKLLQNYRECLTDKTRFFPGLELALQWLDDQGLPWGIVTNKPSEYADPIVQLLMPSCPVMICPDHVSHPKPNPEGITLACEKLNVSPSECLYVGDHLRDIQAGQAATAKTLSVGWGYIGKDDQPSTWSADWHIDKSSEILPLLKTLFSQPL